MARPGARALQACGLLVLGAALLANAELRPATECADPLVGACLDLTKRWAAPSATAGAALVAIAAGLLWWAAGEHALGTLLRASLVAAALGALLLALAWSFGVPELCLRTTDAREDRCWRSAESWYTPALVGGGALLGAAATAAGLLLGLAARRR